MTRKQAERIMQMTVTELPSAPKVFRFEAQADGILVRGRGYTPKEALHSLVENNYKRVCALVAQREKYRCSVCGQIRPLQFHHIQHRSKGRLDVETNITCVCQEHHRLAHGG